jgi:anti-sigma regulatory factor (Ser/Thr protein kinase)
MREGNSTATPAMRARGFGAGLGLPNIKRNSDEFKIESTVGVGTTLRYVVYANGTAGS